MPIYCWEHTADSNCWSEKHNDHVSLLEIYIYIYILTRCDIVLLVTGMKEYRGAIMKLLKPEITGYLQQNFPS